jgi:5-(carboxyamino)imidazole ribonucleotide synthase
MLAESLLRLDADVGIYEPTSGSPCEQRLAGVTVAPWDHPSRLASFFDQHDVVTYESENIPTAPLRALGAAALAKLRPGLRVLEVTQDRVEEKRFCHGRGVPTAAFRVLDDIRKLPEVAAEFGFPFLLKSARGGYDGKGQYRVRDLHELGGLRPLRENAPGRWIIEEVLDLALEVSVIVGRRRLPEVGEESLAFPVFENAHVDGILDLTVLPARVTDVQRSAVVDVALRLARALDVEGLLTVEMFFATGPGRGDAAEVDGLYLSVNEMAPRTHNSGHVTRRGCNVSQFDQLAWLLLGGSPLPVSTLPGGFAMAQLLGEVWQAQGRTGALDLAPWATSPQVLEVFQYGKRHVEARRKMGHLIAWGPDADAAEVFARAFRDALRNPTR